MQLLYVNQQKDSMQKQYWAKGPWTDEPDTKDISYKGYQGYIKRNDLGALCGYVMIPSDHPILKGIDLDADDLEYEKVPLNAHGGITFGNTATNTQTGQKVYVVGFDCAHSTDLIPFRTWMTNPDLPEELRQNEAVQKLIELELASSFQKYQTYKDIDFVTKEIESMIDQIINYKE
jgi:hypothetical protein